MWYNRQVNESWPLSQTVKTSPSHGEDMGSIPVGVTTGSFKDEAANLFRAISSAGRAPGSQSGGQGFDPPMVHQRSTPPPRRWGASLVDRVCFRERTPSAAAKPNGRIAMIALRRCVNPPIPGGMNVRSEHLKNSPTCRRTFRFRSPYGPPYEEHNIDILRRNRVFTRVFAPFWHFGSVTKKSRNADIFRSLVGRELMSSDF